jgi:DNA-binding transcriptional LysR family regulator
LKARRPSASRTLRVSASASFSIDWLARRLAGFENSHDLSVELVVCAGTAVLTHGEADAGIVGARTAPADFHAEPLLALDAVAVGATIKHRRSPQTTCCRRRSLRASRQGAGRRLSRQNSLGKRVNFQPDAVPVVVAYTGATFGLASRQARRFGSSPAFVCAGVNLNRLIKNNIHDDATVAKWTYRSPVQKRWRR